MDLILDMKTVSNLTAKEEPEAVREVGVVFSQRQWLKVYKSMKSPRGTTNPTTKLLCSLELAFSQQRDLWQKKISNIFFTVL